MLVDLAKTTYFRARTAWARRQRVGHPPVDAAEQTILDRLATDGVAVVPDFASPALVSQLRHEVDRAMAEHPDTIRADDHSSDHRAWGIDNVSEPIADLARDPSLLHLGRAYMGPDLDLYCTMANHVVAVPGNLGSGGGWHRDTAQGHQFKTLLYLSDVTEDTGPFEYLPGSHRERNLLIAITRAGVRFGQHRFTDVEVARLAECLSAQPTPVLGRAGTLFYLDSSVVHRGRPIVSGDRDALSNYYYPRAERDAMRRDGKLVDYFLQPSGS